MALFCQNLGGGTPTLPTRFRHPCNYIVACVDCSYCKNYNGNHKFLLSHIFLVNLVIGSVDGRIVSFSKSPNKLGSFLCDYFFGHFEFENTFDTLKKALMNNIRYRIHLKVSNNFKM